VALQRYFATTSATAARRSFVVSLVSSAAIGLLLALSGLALRYYYLQHAERLPAGTTPVSGADRLMPLFFVNELPAGLAGLILVSFLCDALQTLGSGVNSIAATITRDTQQQRGDSGIRSARITTLFVGTLTTVLAIGGCYYAQRSGSSIIDMMPRMFNMFLGPLAVMFMVGMFYRRATAAVLLGVVSATLFMSVVWSWWGEVPSVLAGIGMTEAAEWWTSLHGIDTATGKLRTPSVMLAIFAPTVFGLLLGAVASLLFGRTDHPGIEYTWRNVLRRPAETATP
jgi:SSS family solute:Na+ symporter